MGTPVEVMLQDANGDLISFNPASGADTLHLKFSTAKPGPYQLSLRLVTGHEIGQPLLLSKAVVDGSRMAGGGGTNQPMRHMSAVAYGVPDEEPPSFIPRDTILALKPRDILAPEMYPIQALPNDAEVDKQLKKAMHSRHSSSDDTASQQSQAASVKRELTDCIKWKSEMDERSREEETISSSGAATPTLASLKAEWGSAVPAAAPEPNQPRLSALGDVVSVPICFGNSSLFGRKETEAEKAAATAILKKTLQEAGMAKGGAKTSQSASTLPSKSGAFNLDGIKQELVETMPMAAPIPAAFAGDQKPLSALAVDLHGKRQPSILGLGRGRAPQPASRP